MNPEKKIVKFPVWDLEIDEIIEMEMDADDYEAMCKAEEEARIKQEEMRKHAMEEAQNWMYSQED